MVDQIKVSPRITHFEWGRIDIDGVGRYRDAKLYPGGARLWDWMETGTHHEPGIQPADVEELIENGAKVVVLSKGVQEQLMVMPETIEHLEAEGIEVHVLQTERAIEKYNELVAADEAVGALIHSTC